MGIEEQLDEQHRDGVAVVADLVVAGVTLRPVFQPVERTLPSQRRASGPPCRKLASERCQHRIMAKLVMVDQIS